MAEQSGSRKHLPTTFLSLPRELRQQILFYTFYDDHLYDFDHNYKSRYGSRHNQVFETPNMNAWAHDLASTHPLVSLDVGFVASQWKKITEDGWKDFCHAKLVQQVEEACKRVKEQFRLQDEEDGRAYSSQLMTKIPR